MDANWVWIVLLTAGAFLVLLGAVGGVAYDRYTARRNQREDEKSRPLWDQPTHPIGYAHLPAQKARQL